MAAAAGALAAGDGRGRRFPIGGVTLFLPFDADARGVFDFVFFVGGCIGDAATCPPAHQRTNGVRAACCSMSDLSKRHVPTKPPSGRAGSAGTHWLVSCSGVSLSPPCLDGDGDGDVITATTTGATANRTPAC